MRGFVVALSQVDGEDAMKKVCVECGKEYDVDATDRKQIRSIVCSEMCQKLHGYKREFLRNNKNYIADVENSGMKFEFVQKIDGSVFTKVSGNLESYLRLYDDVIHVK